MLNISVINVTIVKTVINVVGVVSLTSVLGVKSVVEFSSFIDDLRVP